MNKKVSAIILIAGNSTRYGQNRNKNFELINNQEVFLYSLDAFNSNNYIDDITIVMKKDEINKVTDIIRNSDICINKELKFVIGGNSRKESVYNAIKDNKSDIVIIHDGARPVIKNEFINNCIESMNVCDGVTVGVKSKDTIKVTDEDGVVMDTTKRSNTWLIQTPQCFKKDILLNMHEKYKDSDVTDDCMLLEKDGYKVKVIDGDYTNIKITTYEDLGIVKKFLKRK